jgi:hypothetical protein
MVSGRCARPGGSAILCLVMAAPLLAAGPETRPAAPEPRAAGAEPRAAGPRTDADWKDRDRSFPLRLDDRLRREALRFPDLAASPMEPLAAWEAEPDEGTRAERGRRVERLIVRALRGALDDHLTDRARESGALPGLFRLLDGRNQAPGAAPGGEALRSLPGAPDGRDRSFRATFHLRLDAHPRLQWRARMGAVTGSIEVPVIDPELRVGLERPLGSFGRAALQGGLSDARGGWASVALSFGF